MATAETPIGTDGVDGCSLVALLSAQSSSSSYSHVCLQRDDVAWATRPIAAQAGLLG